MKTNKLKMIMTIFFTIFILCILSLTVNATNEEIEILEKLEEGEKNILFIFRQIQNLNSPFQITQQQK